MEPQSKINELEAKASSARAENRWTEVRECYEQILSLDLTVIDRAKMLANLMQILDKEGRNAEAIRAGEEAFELVQNYRLYETNEGAHLRGFLRGALGRLRGEPFDWIPMATILLANALGAALGAHIGSRIQYEGLTIGGHVWTDLRYGGAGLGGLLGWLFLVRPLFPMTAHFGAVLTALAACPFVVALCYRLMQDDPLAGLFVVPVALAPSIFVFGAGFIRQKR